MAGFRDHPGPLYGESGDNPIRPDMILALDRQLQVFVSSHPKAVPMLAELRSLGSAQQRLAERIAAHPEAGSTDLR